MIRHGPTERRPPRLWRPFILGAALLASGSLAQAQSRVGQGCDQCHGELELLRQRVDGPDRARALLTPQSVLRGSAHGELSCTECHAGFRRFPHPETGTRTATCGSCHQAADTAWQAGVHAQPDAGNGGVAASCASCHGVHDAPPAARLAEGPGVGALNARCTACHGAVALPPADPHAGETPCAGCHGAHETHRVTDPEALVAAGHQDATCGACHADAEALWSDDAHGRVVRAARAGDADVAAERLPTCTGCHGGHGMLAAGDRAFAAASTRACADCHEKAAETYYGSYHGKAARLGSGVAATCQDCHGSHGVLPQEDPRSRVAEANLVDTCGDCHEHARPAFVQYDSHPDPFDRERNTWIWASFWMMNVLLVGVLFVFGLHTLLWWVRLLIDRGKGHGHAHGGPR